MTLEDRLWLLLRVSRKLPLNPKPLQSRQRPARARKAPARSKGALSNTATFTKDEDLHAYREMLLIRRFEEKAGQMYGMGLIGGFCHLYIGQEAVVIGMQMASKDGDQVITGYRDHGHMLACGMDRAA
jgi:pyruvate dehydrogenase E1 component alpha subunit